MAAAEKRHDDAAEEDTAEVRSVEFNTSRRSFYHAGRIPKGLAKAARSIHGEARKHRLLPGHAIPARTDLCAVFRKLGFTKEKADMVRRFLLNVGVLIRAELTDGTEEYLYDEARMQRLLGDGNIPQLDEVSLLRRARSLVSEARRDDEHSERKSETRMKLPDPQKLEMDDVVLCLSDHTMTITGTDIEDAVQNPADILEAQYSGLKPDVARSLVLRAEHEGYLRKISATWYTVSLEPRPADSLSPNPAQTIDSKLLALRSEAQDAQQELEDLRRLLGEERTRRLAEWRTEHDISESEVVAELDERFEEIRNAVQTQRMQEEENLLAKELERHRQAVERIKQQFASLRMLELDQVDADNLREAAALRTRLAEERTEEETEFLQSLDQEDEEALRSVRLRISALRERVEQLQRIRKGK